nr:helix-turn-helix domain-containing protein [Limnohabitans sp.]
MTEVAMGHGFWHLGRFAGLYKNYYGESPSETVRAMG